jgi:hypothetical protein
MSRFHVLVVLPLVWGVLFLALDGVFFGGAQYMTFLRTEVETVKVLTLVGSWAAALAFERGAYQRRAWFLIGLCMALLLTRDLTLLPFFRRFDPRSLAVAAGLLVALANLSQVIGTWMLARTWKVAQLALPGSVAAQWATVALVGVVAAAAAGPGVIRNGGLLLRGDFTRAAGVFSSLGDVFSLWLIAPLLLTALALRGGLFGWPFALLTTSYVAWLVYDVVFVLGPDLGLSARGARTLSELFRALGCLFGFSAGLAQRWVVGRVRHLATNSAPGFKSVA